MRDRLNIELNLLEYILSKVFKNYTHKVYRAGVSDGYNWARKKWT